MGWLNLLVTTSNEPSNWINERQKNNDEETKTNNGWSLKWKRQKILLWFDEACVPKASRLAPPHFYKGDFFLTSRCYKLDFCQLASHKRKNIDSGYDFSIRTWKSKLYLPRPEFSDQQCTWRCQVSDTLRIQSSNGSGNLF